MRTSILALAAVLMVAGCGDNTPVKLDSGTKHDMAMQQQHDMAMPPTMLSCLNLIQCLNNAQNMTQQNQCINNATSKAKMLLQSFFTCANTACPQTSDGPLSSGACNTPDTCFSCIQTGTSSTGMMSQAGATCCAVQDSSGNCTTPGGSDPKCGACVDQLNACIADM